MSSETLGALEEAEDAFRHRMYWLPEPQVNDVISDLDTQRVRFEYETAQLSATFHAALAAHLLSELEE